MPLTEPRPHVSGLPRILPGFDDQAPGRWIFSIYGRRRCIATNAFPDWGIRGKVNAIPVFRDEAEQDSGMKANTGSGMKPNGFRPIP